MIHLKTQPYIFFEILKIHIYIYIFCSPSLNFTSVCYRFRWFVYKPKLNNKMQRVHIWGRMVSIYSREVTFPTITRAFAPTLSDLLFAVDRSLCWLWLSNSLSGDWGPSAGFRWQHRELFDQNISEKATLTDLCNNSLYSSFTWLKH